MTSAAANQKSWRHPVLTAIWFGAVACSPAAARFSGADSVDLARFEYRLAAAAHERNAPLLDSLLADEWTITLTDGRRSDKRRAIARWTTPRAADVVRDTTLVDSVDVQWLGVDAAVLTAAITDIDAHSMTADTTQSRVTDVVMRRAGRWQAIASHESIRPAHTPPR